MFGLPLLDSGVEIKLHDRLMHRRRFPQWLDLADLKSYGASERSEIKLEV